MRRRLRSPFRRRFALVIFAAHLLLVEVENNVSSFVVLKAVAMSRMGASE